MGVICSSTHSQTSSPVSRKSLTMIVDNIHNPGKTSKSNLYFFSIVYMDIASKFQITEFLVSSNPESQTNERSLIKVILPQKYKVLYTPITQYMFLTLRLQVPPAHIWNAETRAHDNKPKKNLLALTDGLADGGHQSADHSQMDAVVEDGPQIGMATFLMLISSNSSVIFPRNCNQARCFLSSGQASRSPD